MIKRIRNRFRAIKWWFQRANHKLPPCDCWDYKYTLVDNIKQGLDYLLNHGVTDWNNPYHKQEKKDLTFILEWAKDFPLYESSIIAINNEDYITTSKLFENTDTLILTKEEWDKWKKRQDKALKLLAKNISTLWD